MGARNQVGIGLSYRPASLCSLATQFQTWFLELIPHSIAGLKIRTSDVLTLTSLPATAGVSAKVVFPVVESLPALVRVLLTLASLLLL